MSGGKRSTESRKVVGGITKLRKIASGFLEDKIEYYNALVMDVEELREFESYMHAVIGKI